MQITHLFIKFDSDGNGSLDLKEFTHLLFETGMSVSDVAEVRRSFEEVDNNNDGVISYKEMFLCMARIKVGTENANELTTTQKLLTANVLSHESAF